MRLKTKLVLAATALTFAIVLVLSALFVSELLRQRIEQTAAANDVLVHEVWLETRKAVETGLRASPPVDKSDAALHEAVVNALRSQTALSDVMNTIVRYSPTVQDVSVTDAHGLTLVSTDPDAVDDKAVFRYEMHTLPSEIGDRIGTSTLFAAWNAAIYVNQIEDERLDAVVANGAYLAATQNVLQKYGGLWFNDEAFVVTRRRD